MYKVMKMSGRFLAIEVDIESPQEIKNIKIFTSEREPVILVEDLDDLELLDIYDKVELVKDEEG